MADLDLPDPDRLLRAADAVRDRFPDLARHYEASARRWSTEQPLPWTPIVLPEPPLRSVAHPTTPPPSDRVRSEPQPQLPSYPAAPGRTDAGAGQQLRSEPEPTQPPTTPGSLLTTASRVARDLGYDALAEQLASDAERLGHKPRWDYGLEPRFGLWTDILRPLGQWLYEWLYPPYQPPPEAPDWARELITARGYRGSPSPDKEARAAMDSAFRLLNRGRRLEAQEAAALARAWLAVAEAANPDPWLPTRYGRERLRRDLDDFARRSASR